MSDIVICCPLYGGNDGNQAKIFDQNLKIARKIHKCSECGEEIKSGARYEHVKGMWDQSWSTFKTCLLCVEIRDHFKCDEGFVYGELWSQLMENFFPDMKAGGPCMEGLSPAAKQYLIDSRMEWYFSLDEINDSKWEKFKK